VRLLLDTHIWLWSHLQPEKLGRNVARELERKENELWLSPVSIWETLYLAEKRRVELEPSPEEWIRVALSVAPVRDALLNREVAIWSRKLPVSNRDPADRFIAATAHVHELTLVTEDAHLLGVEGLSVLAN
jgi:PIN domain nuclease of toxin-antitoxin system